MKTLNSRWTAISLALICALLMGGPYWDAFRAETSFIYRDVDQTAVAVLSGKGKIANLVATNHTESWIYLKVWDVPLGSLNTTTSPMLIDQDIPPGGGYETPLPIYCLNGACMKVTGATGATDTSDPGSGACNIHVWKADPN